MKKLGGYVCDTCRVFASGDIALNSWIVFMAPDGGTVDYCSADCYRKSKQDPPATATREGE